MMRVLLVAIGLGLLLPSGVTAQEGVRVDRIAVKGNQRVDEEAIRVQIRSQRGTPLDPATVDSDLRAIYRMGFFDDVRADLRTEDGLQVLTFEVAERPQISEIKTEGNKKVNREDLEAALTVRANTILDPMKVRRGIEEAKKLYQKKGFPDARIEYTVNPAPDNRVELVYKVTEGKRVRIRKLVFEGNRNFSKRQLRRAMQTRQKWMFSFLTGAGNLDNEVLKTDMERLTAFYYDHGYIDVRIDEPVVERKEDGLIVTIKIDEGEEYRVGSVDVGGDLLDDMEAPRKRLALEPGEVFRTSKLRDGITTLTDAYGDHGYAFVNVTPETNVNQQDRTVDVLYRVSQGPEVYLDKINITGNTKTRDRVIRRELQLGEQERFSGSKLRRSQQRLRRLGYFEEVNITTRKAAQEDRLDLLVDVKEASTGQFSAGAGVASGESYLLNLRLSEINLFGRGQHVVLNVDYGELRRNISIDFTEPYLRDTQITAGVSLFNWKVFFDEFDRGGTGAAIRFLYPFSALGWESLWKFPLEDTRFGLEYRIEDAEITSVSPFAATIIRTEEGSSLTSSLTPRLFRDTRNHPFDPTDGSMQDLSFEFAGVGGQSKFFKAEARARSYFPFYKSPTFGTFVFAAGGQFGYGLGYGERRELPLFERYFPGGINSVRGYRVLSLGPRVPVTDAFGQRLRRDTIGGSQQLIFNTEIIFPIIEALGVKGVLFFDAGNAFTAAQGIDFGELRMSSGGGFRWLSPIGPLRIEVGFPINSKKGDDTESFMFSFGGPS